MDAARWTRVQTLFHDAAEFPPPDRRSFLETQCADDPSLVDDALALLAEDERGDSLLDRGIGAAADSVLGRSGEHGHPRPAPRTVPTHAHARRGWNGRRLPRRARRPRDRGGDQDPPRRVALSRATRALRQRAAHAGAAEPSLHRASLRRGLAHRRHALVRDGVRRGHAVHRVLPRTCHLRRRTGAPLPRRVRSGATRAPASGRTPRPEAVEHSRRQRRHREAARLRDRQAARRTRGAEGPHAHRPPVAHAGIRGARADPRRHASARTPTCTRSA